jgi:anti-sigma regulatory factor (Ser/Thr protein kinase)
MDAIIVTESSQIGDARRSAVALSKRLGFGQTRVGEAGIIATELATNLVKHGGGGQLLIGGYADETGSGLEFLSLDKGPGMTNVGACLEDGYSTSGTSGTGLGAISRLAAVFDIWSQPQRGTALLARLAARSSTSAGAAVPQSRGGSLSVAYPGENVCGDGLGFSETADGFCMMVADGLGHGIFAAEASNAAMGVFKQMEGARPTEMVEAMHLAMHKTRGAAVGIARYTRGAPEISFCGIGNIAGTLIQGDDMRRMVSHNGTVGHTARLIRAFDYPVTAPFLVVLASDGLATGWSLDQFPGLRSRHPVLIAGLLYRDFRRPRDDVTVLVVRETGT